MAALAYGTETIPSVDKIVGPGNAYVAAAKRKVFGRVGIDMIAGPSEILIICDGKTPADWIAMIFSARPNTMNLPRPFFSRPTPLYDAVAASIDKQLPGMPRKAIIEKSLANRGAIIVTKDLRSLCRRRSDRAGTP